MGDALKDAAAGKQGDYGYTHSQWEARKMLGASQWQSCSDAPLTNQDTGYVCLESGVFPGERRVGARGFKIFKIFLFVLGKKNRNRRGYFNGSAVRNVDFS